MAHLLQIEWQGELPGPFRLYAAGPAGLRTGAHHAAGGLREVLEEVFTLAHLTEGHVQRHEDQGEGQLGDRLMSIEHEDVEASVEVEILFQG